MRALHMCITVLRLYNDAMYRRHSPTLISDHIDTRICLDRYEEIKWEQKLAHLCPIKIVK